jgi:hypothetical protein
MGIILVDASRWYSALTTTMSLLLLLSSDDGAKSGSRNRNRCKGDEVEPTARVENIDMCCVEVRIHFFGEALLPDRQSHRSAMVPRFWRVSKIKLVRRVYSTRICF